MKRILDIVVPIIAVLSVLDQALIVIVVMVSNPPLWVMLALPPVKALATVRTAMWLSTSCEQLEAIND